MQIKDQIALITGAASGMGAETARHLASLGAKTILFDIDEASVKKLAKEIDGIGYGVDVTNEDQLIEALDDAASKYGTPRILVNCAGIAPSKRIVGRDGAMPQADFKKVIDINLLGTFNVMRLVAEKMSKLEAHDYQRGIIINTASIAAFDGQTGQAAYASSKAAIVGLTLPAARDLSKFGIRVMTIAPGVMQTPMMAAMPEEVRKRLEVIVPFPKRLGLPKEFASLAQQIIENDYLNGEVIRLDGALRMPHDA